MSKNHDSITYVVDGKEVTVSGEFRRTPDGLLVHDLDDEGNKLYVVVDNSMKMNRVDDGYQIWWWQQEWTVASDDVSAKSALCDMITVIDRNSMSMFDVDEIDDIIDDIISYQKCRTWCAFDFDRDELRAMIEGVMNR